MKKQNTAQESAVADAMTMINGLELPYLVELAKCLEQHIEQRRKADIFDARRKIEAIARNVGLTMDDLLNTPISGTKGHLPPNYADPNNPDRTWSGLGRKPNWIREYENQGITLDQLRIANTER
jgi:DNA-binding protein H-NS